MVHCMVRYDNMHITMYPTMGNDGYMSTREREKMHIKPNKMCGNKHRMRPRNSSLTKAGMGKETITPRGCSSKGTGTFVPILARNIPYGSTHRARNLNLLAFLLFLVIFCSPARNAFSANETRRMERMFANFVSIPRIQRPYRDLTNSRAVYRRTGILVGGTKPTAHITASQA